MDIASRYHVMNPSLAFSHMLTKYYCSFTIHFISEEYLELLIRGLQQCLPDQLHLDQMIREGLEEGRESFKSMSQGGGGGSGGGASGGVGSGANSNAVSGVVGKGLRNGGAAAVGAGDGITSTTAASANAADGSSSMSVGSIFMLWWKFIMTSLLLAFFLSCISHFAQYYQMTLDQEDSNKLRRRLPNSVRLELASPTSGRLKLPPPTPLTKVLDTAAKDAPHTHLLQHPHTAAKTAASVFGFPQTPSSAVYPSGGNNKNPKTPAHGGHARRELQLSENNPMTPENTSSANVSSRKQE